MVHFQCWALLIGIESEQLIESLPKVMLKWTMMPICHIFPTCFEFVVTNPHICVTFCEMYLKLFRKPCNFTTFAQNLAWMEMLYFVTRFAIDNLCEVFKQICLISLRCFDTLSFLWSLDLNVSPLSFLRFPWGFLLVGAFVRKCI